MVWTMRRMLSAVGTNEGIELLLNRLAKTDNNVQFLAGLTKSLDALRHRGRRCAVARTAVCAASQSPWYGPPRSRTPAEERASAANEQETPAQNIATQDGLQPQNVRPPTHGPSRRRPYCRTPRSALSA